MPTTLGSLGLLTLSSLAPVLAIPRSVAIETAETAPPINHESTIHIPDIFPATLTYISSTTVHWKLGPGPTPNWVSLVIDATTTTTDIWPSAPTKFPHEHVLTLQATSALTSWSLGVENPEKTTTTVSSSWYTTAVIWKPVDGVEYLDGKPSCEGRERSGLEGWLPDSKCVEAGLSTGCDRQCGVVSGFYWCLRYDQETWLRGEDVAMGRMCWGDEAEKIQLVEPCLAGDYKTSCISGAEENKVSL